MATSLKADDFIAASAAAERWLADVMGLKYQREEGRNKDANVTLSILVADLERHRVALAGWFERLTVAADGVVTTCGRSYPSAHEAAWWIAQAALLAPVNLGEDEASNIRASIRRERAKIRQERARLPDAESLAVASQGVDTNKHSVDFRSVTWYGRTYSFTPNQAAVVKKLWEHWQQGTPEVGNQTLLEAADSTQTRLDFVFRDHPAWGVMIRGGATKGTTRLASPDEPVAEKKRRGRKNHV